MGKRLNPHRRLLAAQAATLAVARLEQSRVNGADMAKLQQGVVRSHTSERALMGKTHLMGFQEAPLTHRVIVTRKPSKLWGVK